MLGVRGLTETISHNPYHISIFLTSTTSSFKKKIVKSGIVSEIGGIFTLSN